MPIEAIAILERLLSLLDSQHDPAALPWRFNSLVGRGDLLEREALRGLEAAPSRDERLVDRVRGLRLVPRREVVAAQDVHADILEEQGQKGARGFVSLAFRVQNDMRTYDAFFLRPTNGRADDQVRRNHSVQYISHPDWTWFRLRKESPEKYESYVDLVPDEWTKVKIEVRGAQARLYVHDQAQPTLIVNDLKTGTNAKGGVALWLDLGTVAHFRNLIVTREPAPGRQ